MPETITLHSLDLSGETTLKLFLRKDDGTLLNTGGDDLAEISSSGVFQATLAESRSGLGVLNARVCLSTETADNLVWDGSLPEGSTVLGATVRAELDSASRAAILTQELIESYAADGAAPTVAQALMMILQHHQQKSVSGTTVTIKKLDKSTTASTYTLDSASDPTSITRAT